MLTNDEPRKLRPGVYWYLVPGKPPQICEKREGEDFVRFTNCGRQPWIREGEAFMGPIDQPTA